MIFKASVKTQTLRYSKNQGYELLHILFQKVKLIVYLMLSMFGF